MIISLDMGMPRDCKTCPFRNSSWCIVPGNWRERYYIPESGRSEYCPLSEMPTNPWRSVKDGLPKPHKDVLVSGMEAINNMRVYKVMVNDNGTWRPTDYAPSIRWDYWMPIEPPKEE